jgi:DNA-binding CsgD family transcriptional regulator
MSLTYGDGKVELGRIESILDALLKSESIQDFSRSIVHSDITDGSVQGCHFYSLDAESHIKPISGYGRTYLDTEIALSAWDDDPIAACIRNKEFEFQTPSKEQDRGVLAIPLLKDSIPVGALALVMDVENKKLPIQESLIPVLMKIGAYCLAAYAGSSNRSTDNFSATPRESNGEDLTSRQIKILELMADGLVNVEIARDLMLSESTIRQETVRIYRALGVPNRSEAAKKGRAVGLIKRSTPPRLDQLLND